MLNEKTPALADQPTQAQAQNAALHTAQKDPPSRQAAEGLPRLPWVCLGDCSKCGYCHRLRRKEE